MPNKAVQSFSNEASKSKLLEQMKMNEDTANERFSNLKDNINEILSKSEDNISERMSKIENMLHQLLDNSDKNKSS